MESRILVVICGRLKVALGGLARSPVISGIAMVFAGLLGCGVAMAAALPGVPGRDGAIPRGSGPHLGPGADRRTPEPEPSAERVGCLLPAASDEQLVAFGTYQGDVISTTAVQGQDVETRTARVVVEKGARPLYLILAADTSMIWQVEGEISRVRHVVLTGEHRSGVVGIDSEQVSDLTSPRPHGGTACGVGFYDLASPEALSARRTLEAILERPLDVFAGAYSVGSVSLPSGATAAAVGPGADNAERQTELLRFAPGGVADIDPARVVTSGHAERYWVLPEHAGLAQLLRSGQIKYVPDDVGPRQARFRRHPGEYLIVEPISRFPTGLCGSRSVTFILGTGVPMPAGSPCHSCVIAENTGAVLANAGTCQPFVDEQP